MRSSLLVHCGYPKTATTTLQSWVFPFVGGVQYVGKFYAGRRSSNFDLVDGFRYEAISESARQKRMDRCVAELDEARKGAGKVILVSNETILSQCLTPMITLTGAVPAPTLKQAFSHVKEIGLRAGFDEIKILVTIRKQTDLLSSFFAEAFTDRFGRTKQLRDFSKYIDHIIVNRELVSDQAANFVALDDEIRLVFGDSACQFISFETLKNEPLNFSRAVALSLGSTQSEIFDLISKARLENKRRQISESPSLKMRRKSIAHYMDQIKKSVLPDRSLKLGRIVRPILKRIEYGPSTLAPSNQVIERISMHYASSNREFVSRYPEFVELIDRS